MIGNERFLEKYGKSKQELIDLYGELKSLALVARRTGISYSVVFVTVRNAEKSKKSTSINKLVNETI